ncbi:MAG: hypothetical protein IID36_12840 [Planctomycetes bacterium]|nr:hypothetical protein [Planctomycetota bacterium]
MSAITTLLLFPFVPRRVAAAHLRTPLHKIYLIHWLGLLALAGVVVCIDLEAETHPFIGGGVTRAVRSGGASAAIAGGVVAAGEVVFVLVAAMMTCWAGRDEPISATFRHALRVSWLFVAHLVWVVVAFGLMMFGSVSGSISAPLFLFVCFSGVIVWSIISYLRALTLDRRGDVATPADPMCEWCGYNIAHTDPNGLCSECGKAVADSLRRKRSLDVVADRKDIAGYGDAATRAWFHSETFFRTFAAHERTVFSITHLVFWLGMTVVLSGGAFVGGISVATGDSPPLFIGMVVVLAFGLFIAWCFFILLSAIASLLGWLVSRQVGRNRFAAVHHVVALTSSVIPFWACLAVITLVLSFLPPRVGIFLPMWALIVAATCVAYWRAIARRVGYVQYQNGPSTVAQRDDTDPSDQTIDHRIHDHPVFKSE